ncbi:MAG: hypothetical protein LBT44_08560 [Clostridiales bacterium]|jgi:flagellar M-ring protein FliF|nr:hypothetical protein [Clostridiales bacterium]
MNERLQGILNRLTDRWKDLEKNQKFRLLGIVAVFLLLLGLTIFLTMRTKMQVLVNNRDLTVIADMRSALNDAGIKNKVVNGGRGVAVDEKKVIDAQVLIAQQGLLEDTQGNSFTYLDALNYSGMGTTETIKKENMKKVKESELSSALRHFEGIHKAVVNLTVPDDNYYFEKPTGDARASVVLTVTQTLDKTQSLQVARFICASVDGLTMDNIEISDQNYNIVYSGLQETSGGAGTQYDQELLRKSEIEMKIKVSLAPLFDAVTVINDNLKFNWNKSVETSDILAPPLVGSDMGLVTRESTEKRASTNVNANTMSEPGVAANDQMTASYQGGAGGNSSANAKKSDMEYAFNRTQRTVESATGDLNASDSTIAVMVYRNQIYDQNALAGSGAIKSQNDWEELKASTRENLMDIDFQPIKDIIAKGTGIISDNISVNGYTVPVFVDAQKRAMNLQQILMFSILALFILMLAYGLIQRAQPAEITEIEPALSVEDLLVSTHMDERIQTEVEKLQEIDYTKDSEAKKMIEKFVSERPEAVAQLLRNWLNDNWE